MLFSENNKAPYNNIIFQLNEVEGPKVQTKLNTIEDILNPLQQNFGNKQMKQKILLTISYFMICDSNGNKVVGVFRKIEDDRPYVQGYDKNENKKIE